MDVPPEDCRVQAPHQAPQPRAPVPEEEFQLVVKISWHLVSVRMRAARDAGVFLKAPSTDSLAH